MSLQPEQCPESSKSARGMEVEVKLSCPKSLIANLPDFDALAGANWRARPQRMVSTYFDTESDDLYRSGMLLRLRRTGTRRIMTLKWNLEDQNVFSRGESEVVVESDEPNVDLFPPETAATVTAAMKSQALVARFETRVRRKIAELRRDDALVEIAVDDGEIVAGNYRAPITECELELKDGDPVALYVLAERLTGSGLILNPVQKSQRGYHLIRQEKPTEKKASHPKFDPAASIEDAIRVITENTLGQFIDNWPALIDADRPESVHQMRVALRRLRAALKQFERALPNTGFERFREVAKRLANEFGPARDQDVFIALVNEGPRASFPAEASFESLLSIFEERRLDSYRHAKEVVSAPETSRFVLELQAFVSARGWRNRLPTEQLPKLGTPARDFACETLERLYQRARKLGKSITHGNPEARHELRIALKNLRYCAEFFGSLYDPRKGAKFIKSVGALQDALGEHNDAATALNLLGRDPLAMQSRAEGIILGWCAREISAPDVYLKEAWESFKSARCFWRD